MDHNDETYAPAAGSMFFTMDCQLLDQLNLLKPSLQDPIKAADGPIDNPENAVMGSMIFDMLSMQFPAGGSIPHDRFILTDGTDHTQRSTFNLIHGETDMNKEHEQGFDPVCFLKLPVLAEKGVEQRFSPYSHEVMSSAPLKNFAGEKEIKAHEGRNNWCSLQEAPCMDYPFTVHGSSRNEKRSEAPVQGDKHMCGVVPSESMTNSIPEQTFSISPNISEKELMDHPLAYSDALQPVVLSRSSSGFDQAQNQKTKRKRSRTCKNSEEVESQRMTHIAVERNRRKQMNEHLRVLRALMPGSYVQRGDQASIIGGAIEFVKELEQLLQCLESQKRRRLYSEGSRPNPLNNSCLVLQPPAAQLSYPPQNDVKILDSLLEPLREDVAEVKSPVADIEVKLVGYDAMIKILSQRRPGQLLKTIAALENLQFTIFHTNVTTIEHTVLYSFNVKVSIECSSTAEEIATSVQQIFNLIQPPTEEIARLMG